MHDSKHSELAVFIVCLWYLSQKMLNMCNGQTSILQQKDMYSTKIHSYTHWSAWVCKIGCSLHSSPKHPAETNKTAAERAEIWRSCNTFKLCASPRQSTVLTALVVHISINLCGATKKNMFEFARGKKKGGTRKTRKLLFSCAMQPVYSCVWRCDWGPLRANLKENHEQKARQEEPGKYQSRRVLIWGESGRFLAYWTQKRLEKCSGFRAKWFLFNINLLMLIAPNTLLHYFVINQLHLYRRSLWRFCYQMSNSQYWVNYILFADQ